MRKAKEIFVAVAAILLMAGSLRAEVITEISGIVSPIPNGASIRVECAGCGSALKEKFIQQLKNSGYQISENGATWIRLMPMVSVPKGDAQGAELLHGIEVYGAGIPPIAPALSQSMVQRGDANESQAARGAFDLDGGVVKEAASLTGSGIAGAGIGMAINIIRSAIAKNAEDAKRTPGIANMIIAIRSRGARQNFRVLAAANTPETPDALLDAAIEAAVRGLVEGVPDTKEKDHRG